MGDFNAILDFPPAPKLGHAMRLLPGRAAESELRGEKLFLGEALCTRCHSGTAFVDDYLHDLQVERFYDGRPEGPTTTFALRGIKDSPPFSASSREVVGQEASVHRSARPSRPSAACPTPRWRRPILRH